MPGDGDGLIFGGTTRQRNTNDLTDLAAPWLLFNNGGFELFGNALTVNGALTNLAGSTTIGADLVWSSSAAKTWSIASGSEVVLKNANSIEVAGDHTLVGGGTVRFAGGDEHRAQHDRQSHVYPERRPIHRGGRFFQFESRLPDWIAGHPP